LGTLSCSTGYCNCLAKDERIKDLEAEVTQYQKRLMLMQEEGTRLLERARQAETFLREILVSAEEIINRKKYHPDMLQCQPDKVAAMRIKDICAVAVARVSREEEVEHGL
jgi:hypothetical protein